MKRITIKDVAAAAGVSVGSVSRVLNDGPYAGPKLKAKVLRAVAELGYEPDSVAQSMRMKATRTIGCMLSDISNPIFAEMINAMEEIFQEQGYLFVVSGMRGDHEREKAFISLVRRRRMDGLMVLSGDETQQEINQALTQIGLPVMLLDRELPDHDGVFIDHKSGALEMVRYLIELGHKRIALLLPSINVRAGRERTDGYIQALQEAGLNVDSHLIRYQPASTSFAFSETVALLRETNRPTAIITLGTHMLAGVLKAIESCDLTIPQDISVVSVGDTDVARCATPAITALSWDVAEAGKIAARLLINRIEGDHTSEAKHVLLPTDLVLRKSCAAPARN